MIDREIVMKILKCDESHYPNVLEEKFPHILEKIITLWNSSEGAAYLADLLQPNGRGGGRVDRDGFPDKAWQEIFEIKKIYELPHKKL